MSSAEDIRKLIKHVNLKTKQEVDEAVLAELLENLNIATTPRPAALKPNIWRIIMTSRITRLGMAAAIVVASLVGITLFMGSGSGIVFADVIKPILNARTATYSIIIGEEGDSPVIHDMIMGSRIRRSLEGVDAVSIIDIEAAKVLTLDLTKKKATYMDLKGLPKGLSNPLANLRNMITELQNNPHFVVEELGVQHLDNQELIGFHARCPGAGLTIWADPETGFPVRVELQERQMHVVCKDYQFDVDMDESLFSMEVPQGYSRQETELDVFGATEEDFIEGLRIWAEVLSDGEFPEGVSVEDYVKQAPMIQKAFAQLELSDEETTELGMKLQRYLLFIRYFKGKGKWHYAGKGVKLGDAATAIFWYRPKDSETYRVIYGDLSVKDVVAEDLPGGPPAEQDVSSPLGYQQWQEQSFVGAQEDRWHITADGEIVAHSHIKLRKGPQDTSAMTVILPYAASGELISATCGEQTLEYRYVNKGQYELDLPMDKLEQGQTDIECIWTVPLDALEKVDHGYRTVLRSLIPVISYKLEIVLEPDCGFVHTKTPSQRKFVPFWCNNDSAKMMFGSCGIVIQRQE